MDQTKTLLFSITRKDLVRQTFCTGGNGGQHRNATQNGVRLLHPPSGAVALQRERLALQALAGSAQFKAWHRTEVARRLGQRVPETEAEILARVDRTIADGLRSGQIVIEEID